MIDFAKDKQNGRFNCNKMFIIFIWQGIGLERIGGFHLNLKERVLSQYRHKGWNGSIKVLEQKQLMELLQVQSIEGLVIIYMLNGQLDGGRGRQSGVGLVRN